MQFLPHRCVLLMPSNLLIFSFTVSEVGVILWKVFPIVNLHEYCPTVSSVMFKVSCFIFSNIWSIMNLYRYKICGLNVLKSDMNRAQRHLLNNTFFLHWFKMPPFRVLNSFMYLGLFLDLLFNSLVSFRALVLQSSMYDIDWLLMVTSPRPPH